MTWMLNWLQKNAAIFRYISIIEIFILYFYFSQSWDLKKHVKHNHEHEVLTAQQCDTCRIYGRSKNMKQHMTCTHVNKCDQCDKVFTNIANLKDHLEFHESLKKFKCDICEKGFPSAPKLKRHVTNVHEMVKNFKCATCDKLFAQVAHLTHHVRTVHEGNKDYGCDSCDKTFVRLCDLKVHLKNVHQKTDF